MAFLSILLLLCAFPLSNAVGRLRDFYLIPKNVKNTPTPRNICEVHNYTDFVTVYDEEDNTELYKLISNINGSRSGLIGAHTIQTNYTSKWSNDDDVTFTQLYGTCGKTQICGAAYRANGSWELLSWSNKIYFMCYDEGVGQASDKYIPIPLNKNWTDAQLYCRKNHTDLVSIRNETENEKVKSMVNDSEINFWIGLLYDNIEWFDGGKSAYRKCLKTPSEPKKILFIGSTTSWLQVAPDNYDNALCYKSFIHVNKAKMSWEKALDYCNSNASGLLRIESQNDQIETERELRRQKISDPVWIGLRQSRLFGFWIWVNGLQVGSWTNWKGGHQPEHQKSQYCGAMEKVNGTFKWSDRDCRSKFIVLCEGK